MRAVEDTRRSCAILAQTNPCAFNSFVLRDDENPDQPFVNAPMHESWHGMMSVHPRLCLWAHAEAGKSIAISVGRVLWELGRDPNLRIVIVSETDEKAEEIVSAIRRYIDESAELHLVFPKLRPAKSRRGSRAGREEKWTDHRLTVERTSFARDPSIRACGVFGSIQGARADLVIVDDVCTWRTARTKGQRRKLSAWFKQTIASRLTRRARVCFLNTAYHPDDLVHEYARKTGYLARRFPMRDPVTRKPTWPQRYTTEDIEKKVIDCGGEGAPETIRQIDCVAVREGSVHFQEAWVEKCLELGNGLTLLQSLAPEDIPEGCFTVTGVDIGVGKSDGSGRTCVFTLLIYPRGARFAADDGTIVTYPPGTRQVLNIESGHWDGPEIVKRARRAHERFGSVVFVETNGQQMLLFQFMQQQAYDETGEAVKAFPVLAFQTGVNKWNPALGVAAIGIEMSNGRWIIPNDNGVCAPEVSEWIGEIYAFSPDAHTGDRLMGGWIGSHGARDYELVAGGNVGVRVA
jgi:hypothetical protein